MRATLVALWSALALLAIATLLGVALTLGGDGGGWGFGINALVIWWMTLCVAACCTVLGITGRRIMLAGVACGVAMTVLVAADWDDGPELLTWGIWFGAATFAVIGLLVLVRLRTRGARLLRLAMVASVMLFAAMMYPQASSLLSLEDPWDTWFQRGTVALVILNAAGTLAVFILAAIESRTQPPPVTLPERVALSATCPRCHAACTFVQGESNCPTCGLRVRLDIEEPRCACGYLLYKLDSANCPECGRAVRRQGPVPATA